MAYTLLETFWPYLTDESVMTLLQSSMWRKISSNKGNDGKSRHIKLSNIASSVKFSNSVYRYSWYKPLPGLAECTPAHSPPPPPPTPSSSPTPLHYTKMSCFTFASSESSDATVLYIVHNKWTMSRNFLPLFYLVPLRNSQNLLVRVAVDYTQKQVRVKILWISFYLSKYDF